VGSYLSVETYHIIYGGIDQGEAPIFGLSDYGLMDKFEVEGSAKKR
jgi:hypothetical protein